MVLRSSESQGVFPQNQPWNFKLELPKWLHVTRDWTIELTEFYASNVPKSAKKELHVYCNVCETSLVKEAERSLLRRVFLENNKNQIFIRPYKVPLLFWDIRTLHFEITDYDNKPATFLTNEVCLSVHHHHHHHYHHHHHRHPYHHHHHHHHHRHHHHHHHI